MAKTILSVNFHNPVKKWKYLHDSVIPENTKWVHCSLKEKCFFFFFNLTIKTLWCVYTVYINEDMNEIECV